ncbi:MAG: RagB/SusD family nutrient uptake outer membrane protein [Tannerellaceae bacterium]|jgi:hypothetical protein|nr:RagB/SusD family nutrient uptake outer membrane protein [Tannerellaceae bacterium]
MKRIYNTALAFLLLATSCNSVLDEPAENKAFSEGADYTKSADMILPAIGVYAKLYELGWETYPLIAVRGDDVNAGGLGDQQDYAETDNYRYNKDYWMYNSLWEGFYTIIYNTYTAEDQIIKYQSAGADSQLAQRYIADAYVVRGFLLLQLSRVWGDIFIPEDYDPSHLLTTPVATKDEVMTYISELMDKAIPALQDIHPKDRVDIPGGATKHTALAVKALANLELKNYQVVAEATSQIIQSDRYALEPDFYELFKLKGKLNKENLFELQYSDFGKGAGDYKSYLYAFFGPQSWTPKVEGIGGGWGFFEPSLKYIKFMLDRGETIRLETSVLFTDRGIAEIQKDARYAGLPSWVSNTTRSGDVINDFNRALFSSGKHYMPSDQYIPGRTSWGENKNFQCIRYAEILLMHAEALTQGAKGSALSADEAVNLVRTRSGLTRLTNVTNQQVMDEKYAELAMEWGTRFYDMVRLEKYDELSYDGRTFSPGLIYLPYPQSQVDQLPGLREKK